MKKVLLFILFNILLIFAMYCAMFFFAEHVPGDSSPHSILMIRVERDDAPPPFRGYVRAVGGTGGYADGILTCKRLVYFDYDDVTAFEILDVRGTVLFTIPKGDISSRDRLTVNITTGEITPRISFGNYFSGIYMSHMWGWILMAILAVFLLYMVVLVPISLVRMVISPFRPSPTGAKRRFSGSYPHFIFCIIVALAMLVLYIGDNEGFKDMAANYDSVFYMFFYAYIIGTALYPFAHRSYKGREIRRQRKQKQFEEFDYATTVKYYTVTTYSDGSKESDYGSRVAAGYIGLALWWCVKLAFAPFIVYFALINNYLLSEEPQEMAQSPWGEYSARQGNTQTQMQTQTYPQTQVQTQTQTQTQVQTQAMAPPRPQEGFAQGQTVFAFWPPDGIYYPGVISRIDEGSADISFLDGETATIAANGVVSTDYAFSAMVMQANWNNQGSYYTCSINGMDGSRFHVCYEADGVRENVDFSQFRAVMR